MNRYDLQAKEAETNHVKQVPTSMFFAHNTALGPPYHVLIDTNFINFSIKVRVVPSSCFRPCRIAAHPIASHRISSQRMPNALQEKGGTTAVATRPNCPSSLFVLPPSTFLTCV